MNRSPLPPSAGLGMTRDYFSKNLIPTPPEVAERTYITTSALFHYRGVELIYVTSGDGVFHVNGKNYSCTQGNILILSYHHISQIIACEKAPFTLFRCRIPLNTFLYFLANPCCHGIDFGFEDTPFFVHCSSEEQILFTALMEELKKELSFKSSFHDNMSIFILMELIARIDRL